MRENRLSGSEGGGAGTQPALPTPIEALACPVPRPFWQRVQGSAPDPLDFRLPSIISDRDWP